MISKKLRFEIMKRDGFKCHYCGRKGEMLSLEIDHVIPKSRGGTDDVDNLVTCCRDCNMGKGNRGLDVSELWKDKMIDQEGVIKREWTRRWNLSGLGTIEHGTYVLLSKFINILINKYPCCHPFNIDHLKYVYEDIMGNKKRRLTEKYFYMLNDEFKKGGEFCSEVIKYCGKKCLDFLEEHFFSIIISDECWSGKKKYNEEGMADFRLNYLLSRELVQHKTFGESKLNSGPFGLGSIDSKQSGVYYFVLKYTYKKDRMQYWFEGGL